jgi:hypothetical protein
MITELKLQNHLYERMGHFSPQLSVVRNSISESDRVNHKELRKIHKMNDNI